MKWTAAIRWWLACAALCSALSTLGCATAEAVAPLHAGIAQSAEAAKLYDAGLALAARGDLTRAEQYLVSAMRAGHDEQASMRALLVVCVRASRLRSALTYAAPYLADHPNDVMLRQLVAALHFSLGELDVAERELKRVLSLSAERAEAHYLLALVLLRTRRDDAARGHFARYLALAPTGSHNEEARAALAEAVQHRPERIGG